MRRLLIATTALAVLLVGACGSTEDTAGSGASSSTTSTTASLSASGTLVAPPGSATGGTTADPASCAAVAEASAPAIATRSFPDNPDETWTVADVTENDEGQAVVEIVPASAAVGYPRFRFVTACEGGDAVLLATYALDDGAWILLFTSDAAEGLTFDPELAE